MGEDAMLDRSALPSTVDRLVERFATRCGAGASPREVRQVRDLAESLVLDVVGAMRIASIAEIADALARLEGRRKNRPPTASRINGERRPAGRGGSRRTGSARSNIRDHASTLSSSSVRGSSSKRDAFDITRPSELLDTGSAAKRKDEQPPASVRRMRKSRTTLSAAISGGPTAGTTPTNNGGQAGSEPLEARAPTITLREGEQVVRSSGAGVIIRRARSA